MKIGIIGLGKMGSAIAYRLLKDKHEVSGFDIDINSIEEAQKLGLKCFNSIEELLKENDVIWLMLPAGEIIDKVLAKIIPHLKSNSIIIDGGNSHYLDSVRRSKELEKQGFEFLDCGVSGGLQGRELGFCLMVGGHKKIYDKVIEIFRSIAMKNGFEFIGPSGSGHYVKMIHNGIEYALLESYAEGFHLLKEGTYKELDLEQISGLWLNGSIIRSWILDLTHQVFQNDQNFENISGIIGGGQTGSWTLQEAKKMKIPVPLIEKSIDIRNWSHISGGNYATKLVALLRNKFGGHELISK